MVDHGEEEITEGFQSEETGGFLPLQNKYSKSLSWAENLNFLPKTVNDLFKFSAQDRDLEYLYWRIKEFPVSPDLNPPLENNQVLSFQSGFRDLKNDRIWYSRFF